MASAILTAPKLYIDTNHLINIARLRNGSGPVDEKLRDAYIFIDTCLCDNRAGIVFNMAAPLDWVRGQATLESALEIAGIVESAQVQYQLEGDTFVYLYELLREIERCRPELTLPNYSHFYLREADLEVDSAISVLLEEAPKFFESGDLLPNAVELPRQIPIGEICEYVRGAWRLKTNRPNVFQERIDGFRAAIESDLQLFGSRRSRSIAKADISSWLRQRFKLDRILAPRLPGKDFDEIVAQIDLDQCPATSLYLKAHKKRLRNSTQSPLDSDVDDWLYVPAIAYSDITLMERNLRQYILQADRATGEETAHDPNEAASKLKTWLSLQPK